MQTRLELDSINGLLQRQYEQYRQSGENIEAINRKYHDLKHQIGVIRLESNTEKRLIRIAVYTQNNFLMIRVENYFEGPLQLEEGEFKSTKQDKSRHGYGIKSIRCTAEKYGGSVSTQAQDNWLHLRVLFPIQ